MSNKFWGLLNCPHDPNVLMRNLRVFANADHVVMCELGVERGYTSNRLVDVLKDLQVKKIEFYGVDNCSLQMLDKVANIVNFEHEEMHFIRGDRNALEPLPMMDFIFVDACHCAECVYLDGIAASKKVKVGGYMAFHDTSLLMQYPSATDQKYWQHYESGEKTRPLGVVEGIVSGRSKWEGFWVLVDQSGDDLEWGGVRVYQRIK